SKPAAPPPEPPATAPVAPSTPAPTVSPPPAPVPPPQVGSPPSPPGLPAVPPPGANDKPQMPTPPPEAAAAEPMTCPWILRVEIAKGRTLLEARTRDEVKFRVECEKLNLQAPRGIIAAEGGVKIASTGLDGTCDKLAIIWTDDHVVLEGKSYLKCNRDGQEVELKAERLSLRLSAPGAARGEGAIQPVRVERVEDRGPAPGLRPGAVKPAVR